MKIAMALACGALALVTAFTGALAAQYPGKSVELIVAGNAGGGLDLVARELDVALRESKLVTEPLVIKNVGGGGGNVAKNQVHQRKGESHLLYLESNRIFVNKIVGT